MVAFRLAVSALMGVRQADWNIPVSATIVQYATDNDGKIWVLYVVFNFYDLALSGRETTHHYFPRSSW